MTAQFAAPQDLSKLIASEKALAKAKQAVVEEQEVAKESLLRAFAITGLGLVAAFLSLNLPSSLSSASFLGFGAGLLLFVCGLAGVVSSTAALHILRKALR